jgi:hypothetical protein
VFSFAFPSALERMSANDRLMSSPVSEPTRNDALTSTL